MSFHPLPCVVRLKSCWYSGSDMSFMIYYNTIVTELPQRVSHDFLETVNKHLLSPDRAPVTDHRKNFTQVCLGESVDLSNQLTRNWIGAYTQAHRRLKGSRITEQPTPALVMTHKSYIPGASCPTDRNLHQRIYCCCSQQWSTAHVTMGKVLPSLTAFFSFPLWLPPRSRRQRFNSEAIATQQDGKCLEYQSVSCGGLNRRKSRYWSAENNSLPYSWDSNLGSLKLGT